MEDTVQLNSTIEIEQANTTMMYLTRQINGKEQRIVVLGDADCIGNGELTRTEILEADETLISHW